MLDAWGEGLCRLGDGFICRPLRRSYDYPADEELVGALGEVREPLDPEGQVFIQGALWRARASGTDRIGLGNRVRVKAVDGLTLEVEPAADQDPATVQKGA